MRRCTYLGCGGSMLLERVEQVFQCSDPETELRCISCGRSADPPSISSKNGECPEIGCTRPGDRDGRCRAHCASFAGAGMRRSG